MPLRSLLLAALLLAALVAAWKNDVFVSYWFNMTASKVCAVDDPSRCFLIPRLDPDIDQSKTLVVVVGQCGSSICEYARQLYRDPIGEFSLLRYITVSPRLSWLVVNITRTGLLVGPWPFEIKPLGGGQWLPSTSYTACGRTYRYARDVQPGAYNISQFTPPYYLVDLRTCTEYRIAEHARSVPNFTAGWYGLYVATMHPEVYGIYYEHSWRTININGTLHLYRTAFHVRVAPLGAGIYTVGASAAPTLVMAGSAGPMGYDFAERPSTAVTGFLPYFTAVMYNIGAAPGDALINAYIPGAPASSKVEVAYVADNATGYAVVDAGPFRTAGHFFFASFHRRYAVVEIGARDGEHIYTTRGVACPYVAPEGYFLAHVMSRLGRTDEIELCNNSTAPIVAALVHRYESRVWFVLPHYFFVDVIEPGKCRWLRWDSGLNPKPALVVYQNVTRLCGDRYGVGYMLYTTGYNPGWRHFYFANRTIKPIVPIAPDYDYANLWSELLRRLLQHYLNMTNLLGRQLNATNATAPMNLTNFFRAVQNMQFLGTIKMESSTSMWLRTVLNELQRWRITAPAVGGAVSVSLQAPSALAASAAAAAVATAWAASRRSLATAAFIAGFAILATALFTAALYGATVSAALILVGTMLMAIGAAAAWQKQTGEE